MFNEQRIRAVLFYTSLCIFFLGLPVILSFALGLKFDRRTFKFTKTGIIFIKTQPSGASIYLDNKLLNDKTPLTLRAILPGNYKLKLFLDKYSPWVEEIRVNAAQVTMLDKIMLFPLRPDIKQINKGQFNLCWLDDKEKVIYYANFNDLSLYSSDMEGEHFRKVSDFVSIDRPVIKWKFSPDRSKLLYFNNHQIGLVFLEPSGGLSGKTFVLEYNNGLIADIFWHSDNYHLVIVSDRNVEVIEAKQDSSVVELIRFNKKNTDSFYNQDNDTLYFIDSQKLENDSVYENLYKMELNKSSFPFSELIKLRVGEREKKNTLR